MLVYQESAVAESEGRAMTEEMDRREFVRLGACAAAVLTLGGVTGCAGDEPEVETPEWTFGEETEMSKRVLVGYATKNGSTVDVAKAIGEAIGKRGYAVDVKPLSSSPSVSGYDAVVLGSAVNGGQWLAEAVSYVERNARALSGLPVAAFAVHGMNAGDDEKQKAKRLAYLGAVRKHVKLADEGYFLGKLDDMGAIARFAFKAFGGAGEGDMRDWAKIRAWGEKVSI